MIPLDPHLGTRALGSPRPVEPFQVGSSLGCAPCKAMQRQKEANEEFARRYGVVRDPRDQKNKKKGP
jgi:hypothetical protein